MNKYYFSFGSGHHDTHGRKMDGYYTIIEAPTDSEAREIYFDRFGSKWSMTYDDPSVAERWGWQYLAFPYSMEDLCSQLSQEDAVKLFGPNSYNNRYPRDASEAQAIIDRLTKDFGLSNE